MPPPFSFAEGPSSRQPADRGVITGALLFRRCVAVLLLAGVAAARPFAATAAARSGRRRPGRRRVPRPHRRRQPRDRSHGVRGRAQSRRARARDRHGFSCSSSARRSTTSSIAAAVCHQRAAGFGHSRHDHRHRRPVDRARRRADARAGDRSVPGRPRTIGARGDRHGPGPRPERLAHERSQRDPRRRQGRSSGRASSTEPADDSAVPYAARARRAADPWPPAFLRAARRRACCSSRPA